MKLSTMIREAIAWRLVLLAFRLHPPLVGYMAGDVLAGLDEALRPSSGPQAVPGVYGD
jgi:hypothetical protein